MATHNDARDDAGLNTAQLRARIPSARTVSTNSAHEPAAAPFDTDDEAAGRPPQRAAIEQALAHEGRPPVERRAAARRPRALAPWIMVAVLLLAAIAILAVVS